MAVVVITGVPGTGKTLFGIQRYIIPALQRGEEVWTNIDGLITARIALLFNMDYFDVDARLHLLEHPERFWVGLPKNANVVIDEAQNLWSNREWQKAENKEVMAYLMEHRHLGHRVVMITPHVDSLDPGIRRVTELTYRHKTATLMGARTRVRCTVFDQCNTGRAEGLQAFVWHHDKRIYDCYSSYFSKGTLERKPSVNVFAHFGLWAVVVVTVMFGWWGFVGLSKFAHRMSRHKQVVVTEQPQRTSVKASGIHINGGPAP